MSASGSWPDGDLLDRIAELERELAAARKEIERLRIGHERYETARLMHPNSWADAWKVNASTGKPLDEIIDDLRPFVRPK